MLALLAASTLAIPVRGQLSGSRGGVDTSTGSIGLPSLGSDIAQQFITVEAQAELRLAPTEIRVVIAVTSEGKTPSICNQQVEDKLKQLRDAWIETGIKRDQIVEDFIAVLPRYQFDIEVVQEQETAVEKKVGYILQTNVHLAVPDEATAMQAVKIAFAHDVSDIIAFDYWSKELDDYKRRVRELALKEAQQKAAVILRPIFSEIPPIINVQEKTTTVFPESKYRSFSNSNDSEYRTSFSRRSLPEIRTFRPKNTYYHGLKLQADVQPPELTLRAKISVVSTVRLYFASPARQAKQEKPARDAVEQ